VTKEHDTEFRYVRSWSVHVFCNFGARQNMTTGFPAFRKETNQ
jgi:hypothetical protein